MKTQDFYGTSQGAWRRTLARIAATGAVAALAACQTSAPERPTGTVLGRVRASDPVNGPLLVLALERATGKVVHRAFIETGSAFSMALYSGTYKFYACIDENRDGRCGDAELRSVTYSLTNEVHAGDVIQMPTFSLKRREIVAAAR